MLIRKFQSPKQIKLRSLGLLGLAALLSFALLSPTHAWAKKTGNDNSGAEGNIRNPKKGGAEGNGRGPKKGARVMKEFVSFSSKKGLGEAPFSVNSKTGD